MNIFRKKNMRFSDCFQGKTSLAKNLQMFFRGGGRGGWGRVVANPVTRPVFPQVKTIRRIFASFLINYVGGCNVIEFTQLTYELENVVSK